MRNLAKENCLKYDVSRFFAELEVELSLVFQDAYDGNITNRSIDLIIGKRRRYTLSCECKQKGDVYMLVKKDGIFISYDKLDVFWDENLQKEVIDIEGYLVTKGYKYSPLDSKMYSRERLRKKVHFIASEIHKYGEFEATHSWLDIDVYSARAYLFPGACKMGDIDVVKISYSSFDDDMIEPIKEMTENNHCWDLQEFKDFFGKLAKCNSGVIEIATGKILFGGFVGGELEIIRNFEDGEYSYKTKFDKYHSNNNEIDNLGTFAYSIMHASSFDACKKIEAKARMLFGFRGKKIEIED